MTRNGRKRCLTRLDIRAATDGIRFETVYGHLDRGDFDLDYFQIVMEYLRAIGIDIEVEKIPVAQWGSYNNDRLGEGLFLTVHNADYITASRHFLFDQRMEPVERQRPGF